MNLIKDLVKANIGVLRHHVKKNNNPDTSGIDKVGISGLQRKAIERNFFNTAGFTKLFGKNFEFSSGNAFLHSLDEIFENDIYKFNSSNKAPYILDCGANYGLSVLYFYRLFPSAEIKAFEPDPGIFRMLQHNIAQLPAGNKIKLFNSAVWTEDTEMEFFSEGTLGGSVVIDYFGNADVMKVTATDLKKYICKEVDFLKIDIEGAENELIFDIYEKLPLVKNLFLEYHGIRSGKQNLADILNIITKSGFRYNIYSAVHSNEYPFVEDSHNPYWGQFNICCYRR